MCSSDLFTYEHREKRFHNTAERTTATDQNSGENNLQGTVRFAVFPNLIAGFTGGILIDDARKDFRSRVEPSGTLSLSYYFDPGLWSVMEPWSVNATVTRRHARYNAPDPSVDPNVRRIDDIWQGGMLTTVPLPWRGVSAYQQVLRTESASTLPNFAYKDLTVAGGVTWKF